MAGTKKTFTLVELMVVIFVLATIVGIISHGYLRIKNRVQLNACRANMKVLYNASQLFLFDNTGSTLPNGEPEPCNIFQKKLVKEGYIREYVRCPSARNNPNLSIAFYAIVNEPDLPDKPLTVRCVHMDPLLGPSHGSYDGKYSGGGS